MNKEFSTILLGETSPWAFAAFFIIALVGVLLSLLLQSTNRDVKSFRTPVDFSWKFLLSDNMRRIVAGLLLILVALRFTPELFQIELNPWVALIIGFVNDKIAEYLKDRTNILGQKKSSK